MGPTQSSTGNSWRIRLAAMALLAVCAEQASGKCTYFVGTSPANFNSPASWDNGVPGPGDEADVGAFTGTLNLSASLNCDKLYLMESTVTMNLGGHTLGLGSWDEGPFALTVSALNPTQLTLLNGTLINNGAVLGMNSEEYGAVIVGAGASVQNQGYVCVGQSGWGTLTIHNGGTLTAANQLIAGNADGSGGTINVDGTGGGATLTVNYAMIIGADGSGTMNVTNGGHVSAGQVLAGDGAGTGIISVDGAGSSITGALSMVLGNGSWGSLAITNGAMVANGDAFLGLSSGYGAVTVDGTGSAWHADNITMGSDGGSGSGTLNISHGGHVSAGDINVLAGDVYVDGAGSNLTGTGNILLGNGSSGNLTVTNGGTATTASAIFGDNGGIGSATVDGAGSMWTVTNQVHLGWQGSYSVMNITNSGTVNIGTCLLGDQASGGGGVTVDGAGSSLNVGSLVVGNSGGGTIYIGNGGLLTSTSTSMGNGDDGAHVTIEGTGSTWVNSGQITVANNNDAEIDIINGGHVISGSCIIGNGSTGYVLVSGDGTFDVGGTITIGPVGIGTLQIDECSHVSAASLQMGENGSSEVAVNSGSVLSVTGNIHLYEMGMFTMSGGTVSAGSITGYPGTEFSIWGPGNIFTTNGTMTVMANIVGVGDLTKTGSGTLIFGGVNSYMGPTTVSAGKLLGDTSNIQGVIHNNAIVEFNQTFGGTYAGSMDGTGALVKTGAGTLTLGGTNTYSGGTTVSSGGLTGNTTSLQGAIHDNSAVTFNQASGGTYSGVMDGTGSLTKSGAGTLTLSGVNSYSGGTTVSAGGLTGNTTSLQGAIHDNAQVTFNQTADGTYSGLMDGTGSLTKTGAGTLTLSGANSYSGGTTVSAGGLTGNTTSLQGTIHDNAQVTFNQTVDGTYSGVMDGSGSLTKSGAGNLTLSGANSYSGGTTVSAGILTGNTSSLQGAIHDNANVTFSQSSIGTYSGSMDGAGSFTKSGGGNLTLSGTNTYSGGTTVSAGTLTGNTTSLQGTIHDNAAVLFNQTADGTYSGSMDGIGTFIKIGSGNLTLSGTNTYSGSTVVSAGMLTGNTSSLQGAIHDNAQVTFNQTADGTYSGVMDGSGSLTKTGAGMLTLSGANSYSGGTTVSAGILAGNTTSLQGAIHDNAQVTFNQTTDSTYSGVIDGSGSLTKTGAGTLTLGGANSYSGGTTVSAGGLTGNTTSLQGTIHNNSAVTFNQTATGTYSGSMDGTGSLAKTGAGTLTLSGTNTYSGGTTVSAGILAGNTTSLQGAIHDNAQVTFNQTTNGTYSSVMDGIGSLTKSGAGTLTLSGANIYSGGTTVSAGTLEGNTSSLQGAIHNNAVVLFTQMADGTYAGSIDGSGSLTKAGAGTLILSAANSYSGGTTVSAGTLEGNATSLQGTIHDNAQVTFNQTTDGTYGGIMDGSGNLIKAGSGTLTLSGTNTYSGGTTVNAGGLAGNTTSLQGAIHDNAQVTFNQTTDGTYGGTMDGSGSLTKTGAGTLTLSGVNSYSGGTTVSAGMLLGNTTSLQGAIHDNAQVTFNQTTDGTYGGIMDGSGGLAKTGAGTLTLSGANSYSGGTTVSTGTLAGNTTSLQGAIHDNAQVIFNQAADGTYSGMMDGTGSLTKTGSGALTLTGGNTYHGGTTVSAGTLQGNTNSLQGDIHNNSLVIFDQLVDGTYSGSMDGTGSLTKTGAGTLTLSGSNTYTGVTTVLAGILVGNISLQGIIHNNSEMVFDQTTDGAYGGSMDGTGSLTKTGVGVLTLSGVNTYSGGTTVSAGGLIGNTTSLQGAIHDNAQVTFNQTTDGTYGGTMDGSGSLTKTGAGTLTLSGVNSYSGGTTVSAGMLLGNTTSLQGAIHDNAQVAFNQTTDGTYGGIMDGGGALTKTGAGTLTLSGANSYTGGTMVSDGGLAGSTTSLQGAIHDNAQVTFNQIVDGTYSGVMDGSGSLTKTGAGVLTLSGANTYSGGTTVSAGGLIGNTTSLQGAIHDNAQVTFSQTVDGMYSGVIDGSGSLTKTGAGVLTLSGANTYSGGTTVSAGGLMGNTTSLQGAIYDNAQVIFNQTTDGTYGGIMDGTGSLTKTGAGMLTLSGINSYGGGTTVSAGILSGNATSLQGAIRNDSAVTFNQTSSGTYSGVMDGVGSLTKNGTGTLILSGANSYSGGTTVTAGILSGNSTSLRGDIHDNSQVAFNQTTDGVYSGTMDGSGSITKTGAGTLTLSGTNTYSGGTTVSAGVLAGNTASLQGPIHDNAQVVFDQTTSGVYLNVVDGTGSLVKSGVGTLTLSGANTYSGGTTVSGGILAGNTTSLQGTIHNNSAVTFNQTTTGTYSGSMDGTGSLTKTGTGTLALAGTSTYSGGTDINAGTLSFTSGAIGSAGSIAFGGGTLQWAAGNTQDVSGRFTAITSGQSARLDTNGNDVTLAGSLTGAGSLFKTGAGTLTLAGANNYSGGTTVSSGTLAGNTTSLTGDIHNNSIVLFDQLIDGTYAGSMDGSGSLTKAGAGTLTLSGNNTYSGVTTVLAGALVGNISLQGVIHNSSIMVFDQTTDGTYGGSMDGTGSLTKTGDGTLTLTGVNTYAGGTTVSAGALAGSTASLQGAIHNGTQVVFGQTSDGTYSGSMDGAGSLVKTGTGMLTMTGANSYSGGTTVSAGVLAGNTTSLQGDIHNSTQVIFDQAVAGIYSGAMDGSGSLTKTGTGTLTISGANSYSGGTTVSAGMLTGDSTSLQGTIHNNSQVTFNQAIDGTYSGSMDGSGILTKTGSGKLALTGSSTVSGQVNINAGTLSFVDGSLGTSSIVFGGGVLQWALGNTQDISGMMAPIAAGQSARLDTNGNNVTLAASLGGDGGLVKMGDGILTLTGINTYTGGTTILGGSLESNTGMLQGDITNGGTIVFNQTTNGTFASAIDGGEFQKTGDATLTLTGRSQLQAADFSGGTVLVTDEAQVASQNILIADQPDKTAAVEVTGAGAAMTGTTMYVGGTDHESAGTGHLAITAGGSVSASNALTIWSTGSVAVEGAFLAAPLITDRGALTLVHSNVVGNIDVESGGILKGTGTVVGNIANRGALRPGNSIGTLVIDGDYTQSSGSTMEIELNPAGNCDLLDVTGSAAIGGGDVQVVPQTGTYTVGSQYTFLHADGGVTGQFDGLVQPAIQPAVAGFLLNYGANDVYLSIARLYTYAELGRTPNERSIGTALDGVARPAAGDMGTVLDQLDQMPIDSYLSAIDQMSPASFDAVTASGLDAGRSYISLVGGHWGLSQARDSVPMVASSDDSTNLLQTAYSRQNGPDRMFSTGDRTYWLSNINNWSGQKNTSSSAGYRSFESGMIVGADSRLTDEVTVGASLGYTQTTLNWFDGYGHGMVEVLHSSLYGRWARDEFYTDVELGLGYDWLSQTRRISAFDRQADSDHAGMEYMARIGGGYDWRGNGWTAGPTCWLQYVNLHEQGFSESGADALDISVDSRNSDSLQSGLGFRAARELSLGHTKIVPTVHAEWVHEYENGGRSLGASFSGAPGNTFSVVGTGAASDNIVLGTGVETALTRNLSLGVSYDLWLPCGSDFMASHSLQANLKYSF